MRQIGLLINISHKINLTDIKIKQFTWRHAGEANHEHLTNYYFDPIVRTELQQKTALSTAIKAVTLAEHVFVLNFLYHQAY